MTRTLAALTLTGLFFGALAVHAHVIEIGDPDAFPGVGHQARMAGAYDMPAPAWPGATLDARQAGAFDD